VNGHRIRRSVVPLVVTIAPLISASVDANRPSTIFRSGVDIVHLSVVVTDQEGRFATGLERSHFAVLENGVPQDLEFFSAATVPLDLAVLLDTSASMTSQMPIVQSAAQELLGTLRGGDRGMIIGFNTMAQILAPFTGDMGRLKAALQAVETNGDTALHTALYVALQTFGVRNDTADIRRRALMVLSDGDDTASRVAFDDVLALARRAGVSIYTVSLGSHPHHAMFPNQRRRREQADFEMRALARESGARAFFPEHASELRDVYRHIVDDLAHQYVLGYVPKNPHADGTFRRVAVQVVGSARGVRTRTRSGYMARCDAGRSTMTR